MLPRQRPLAKMEPPPCALEVAGPTGEARSIHPRQMLLFLIGHRKELKRARKTREWDLRPAPAVDRPSQSESIASRESRNKPPSYTQWSHRLARAGERRCQAPASAKLACGARAFICARSYICSLLLILVFDSICMPGPMLKAEVQISSKAKACPFSLE